MDEFTDFFESLRTKIPYWRESYPTDDATLVERTVSDIESYYRAISGLLLRKEAFTPPVVATLESLLDGVSAALEIWKSLPVATSSCCALYFAPNKQCTLHDGGNGRPRYLISQEQVQELCSFGFNCKQIAGMLGVSRNTMSRRFAEWGLQRKFRFSNVSDAELINVIREIHLDHRHVGCTVLYGLLRARGLHIQRDRVHSALRQCDPLNVRRRWGALVTRKKYSVKGANSLWHIDGHHSLIRWGIVIHGGIDGFSRLVVFLSASGNNRAATVLKRFEEAAESYGYPSRVRSDKGLENVLVCRRMVEVRGVGRRSFITGRSVHNQRIERLWRDVYRCFVITYYSLFYHFEHSQILDPSNPYHIFALRYVFLPRINAGLKRFRQGWNFHKLRTERNWSPNMIWVNNMISLAEEPDEVDDSYGVDDDGPADPELDNYNEASEDEAINETADYPCPMSGENYRLLCEHINPLKISTNHAQDVFEEVLNYLETLCENNDFVMLPRV